MGSELAYAILTPHTVRKGRIGAVLSQLLSRAGLDWVAGGLFQAGPQLVEAYADSISDPLIADYVRREFPFPGPSAQGPSDDAVKRHEPRALLLVFRGGDAVRKLAAVVGAGLPEAEARGTIRGVFGDHMRRADDGRTQYFEPAVLAAPSAELAARQLRLWLDASDTDLMRPVGDPGPGEQRTLVLLKPDNFRFPSTRPGALMGVFSRAGLLLESLKVHHMSLAEAAGFYREVLPALEDLYRRPERAAAAADAAAATFDLTLPPAARDQLGQQAATHLGRAHWENLIAFMTGHRPSEVPAERHAEPGSQKIIALAYRGVDAVAKIRATLGPTDPAKAPLGTVRREFGQSMMINAAHASDSPANAARELALLGLDRNHLREALERSPAPPAPATDPPEPDAAAHSLASG